MTVRLDVAGGVAHLAFDRPEASNALDMAAGEAFEEALLQVRDDDAARVLLLSGNGRMFSSGGDLAAMADAQDRPSFVQALADQAHRGVRILDGLQKPVVVAVQGAAAGIGLSFVLASDLVVAARSARFVTAYTSVGLTPDGGQSWLLPRTVGLQRALELTLTPRRLTAEEAQQWGIVTRVVDDEAHLEQARALAEQLAAGPAEAFGRARRLLRSGWERSFDDQLDVEARSIAESAGTEESRALIEGFLSR
ncbi:enoyl-CoA hydratase/isomerase family protein [Aeromicrobium sp. CTD01-1L150]|uniref:enoyl-CoA hydratase/isomerase family protein n=1 Tax=Aeromicrobium sp. CTD01-1L150 TaxID=3341830 RepID=UPI0035C1DA17